MFREIFAGPFGTEFEFPTLEQVAAVLLPGSSTFYLTAPKCDGYVPVHTDVNGRVTDWDKQEQETLGLEFSPTSKVQGICFDCYDESYSFTLCEDCE